ncbi:MAG: polysaccharide deacetylase family protein [Coriobacteriia bacterium]|nr:polysaccharide deacetylase family protein [Coriobacteriia bacterium]
MGRYHGFARTWRSITLLTAACLLALASGTAAFADTTPTAPPPSSETTTPTVPPSSDVTPPAPGPRPIARSVTAPIVARNYRAFPVSCIVSATTPATVTVEYRRIIRGKASAWRPLAQRVLASPMASKRVAVSVRLRTRGLYQVRMSVSASGCPGPTHTSSRRVRSVGSKVVALTFDDGPSGRTTPLVLAALRSADAPATFFLTGRLAAAAPGTTRRIHAEGHLLASHSLAHRILTQLGGGALASDLASGKRIVESISGQKVTWLRPPYGSTSPRVADAIRSAGMRQVLWTVDPQDWRGGSAGSIAGHVLSHTRDGSIVLMHDSGGQVATTGRAVPIILSGLKRRGYDCVNLDELAALGYRIR